MDATFHGGSNDTIGGRGRLRRPWPTSAAGDIADLYPSTLAAPHHHGVLVLVTGNKFIAGVVVTGDKVIAGVVVTGEKLFTGFNDTCDD
jgi:hypothetical protein